jgi:hypothetical protein
MTRSLLPALGLTLALIVPAGAQTGEDTRRAVLDFGLIGVWAAQCDKPASGENNHATYALSPGGMLSLTYDLGGNNKTHYAILQARRAAADRLEVREKFLDSPGTLDLVIVKTNDRIRVWSSRRLDGDVLVKDGMIVGNRPTSWLQRCR